MEKYCRELVVARDQLVELFLNGHAGNTGRFAYAVHFQQYHPGSLRPTDAERAALAENGLGPLKGKALKLITKVTQMFKDRRLLAVHLFYSADRKYWHMIYFDQRDNAEMDNHWQHGPHIHYSSELFTTAPLQEIWANATSEQATFPPSVHIRYVTSRAGEK